MPDTRDHRSPIGHVLRTGPEDLLVVDVEGEPVDPGSRCHLEDGRPAGVVQRVIGPVNRPLLVVDPSRGPKPEEDVGPSDALVGSKLYPR